MNYHYPPPWWSGGPPNNPNPNKGSKRQVERDIRRAVRDAMRLRDKDKTDKRKRKEESKKKAANTWKGITNFIYIFALGLLLHPVVGPLVNHLATYLSKTPTP